MSADIHTQQRWLITGVAILSALLILVVFAIIRSVQSPEGTSRVSHRSPAAELAYCGPEDTGLCIVSFDQVVDGDMIVTFQVPLPFYPEFSLAINRYGVESTYKCKRMKGLSTGVVCMGPPQVPGEVLQFKVISKYSGRLLAEGKFAIIGLALSTPEIVPTDTPEPTVTPVQTPPGTSYPNPSYGMPAN